METTKLKKIAQFARRSLLEQVSAKLKLVLVENSAARRESVEAIRKLEEAIKNHGKEQVIERVAYIWFNRFCALRFMDVNRYTRIGVVSPAEGQFQPEILAEAKMGHIDDEMVHDKVRQQIFALLDGKAPSHDPQGEAYRLLVVAACNFFHRAMPFLFQRIDDYTELLMPDDLLSGNSILAYTREAMTPDACEDVEVIGWLYQFYISEKKDAVFDGLKKNKKITPENIPAATQLFTPHWIVRYLVDNSLGRLWLLNRPGSRLVEQMEYYIPPERPETDFLRINRPEDIKVCDPACGSGHMLTYAFDLLYAIYEEEGVDPAEIPEKILTHNLYGIEIDERAGELAAFALTMKARAKQRRFFNKGVKPNVCVLENIAIAPGTLDKYAEAFGRELFTPAVRETLQQFTEIDNFGSLIIPKLQDPSPVLAQLRTLRERAGAAIGSPDALTGDEQALVSTPNFRNVIRALEQAEILSPRYAVVVANPPYMGGKGMNGRLATWVKDNYPNTKSDLFAMFIERNLDLAQRHGVVAMITMQSWMFLSSFEALRARILGQNTLLSMAHLGARAFDSIGGEVVSTTAFVLENANRLNYKGGYLRLVTGNSEAEKNDAIREAVKNPDCGWLFRSSAADFKKIPGSPIAYWVSEPIIDVFRASNSLSNYADIGKGLDTGDNNRFLRCWYEVQIDSEKWIPCQKGGAYRKWFGNNNFVINWANDGEELKKFSGSNLRNAHNYFREGLTWTRVSSNTAFRFFPSGQIFESTGPCLFPKKLPLFGIAGFLNSKLSTEFLKFMAPTLDFQSGHISSLPIMQINWEDAKFSKQTENCINLSCADWDAFESSWDFTRLPLLNPDYRQSTLKATYQKLRAHWREVTLEMQRLEEENNRIFIDAYGLQDELTPEVPLNEITLTCNPHYRYGVEECEVGSEKWEEMEARLLQDTMKELVSYAVGCMFGRYSLDMPGLVLANQGETIADYVRKVKSWKCEVESKRKNYDSKKLSGADYLAEGDGFGGVDLSGDQKLSQGGTVRSDESDPQSGSFNSIQHCGRASQAVNIGVQKLSVDSTRLQSGSGNPTDDRPALGLSSTAESRANPESVRGNQTHDLLADIEAITSHFPLPTSHLSFIPDEDNVIPMLDGDWFTDDIAERFRKFLRVAFGDEHYEDNLQFIEQALGKNGKARDIRDYFLKDFYSDHVKRYKKRPIYWLFSSPKGSFNALIYMHRYRTHTVSTVLEYLRDFKDEKLRAHKNHLEAVSISASSSQSEKTKALKEIEKITKMIAEMEEYEREVLYPLATEQVEIDLDDGVKANYSKFGAALKKIPGLDTKDE
ncbi:conserved hypothetical protein [Nitrosomonas nitrosa]|jgi:type II restriction/modification system DNA methylase subunit YeeA|uniref:site-specific DNA-methyltransferase (adenine-specific) n=1 Tax=Nitrosomonas nitrosa TaxID=52442 RepID=A0A8H8Z257_9PROT|nr:conserved hypothetical protein [Nitrosomonas nitrosa]